MDKVAHQDPPPPNRPGEGDAPHHKGRKVTFLIRLTRLCALALIPAGLSAFVLLTSIRPLLRDLSYRERHGQSGFDPTDLMTVKWSFISLLVFSAIFAFALLLAKITAHREKPAETP